MSIDACNALQLDLKELISEGEEGDNETEVDAKGGGRRGGWRRVTREPVRVRDSGCTW